MGQQRRRWSPEFERDVIALVRSSGRLICDVAGSKAVEQESTGSGVSPWN
jgi:transposase-like protein